MLIILMICAEIIVLLLSKAIEFYRINGIYLAVALLAFQALWLIKEGYCPQISIKQGTVSIKMP